MPGSTTEVQKVVTAARAELASAGTDVAAVGRLLEKVDLLLGRAGVEDGMVQRRQLAGGYIESLLEGCEPEGEGALNDLSLSERAARVMEVGAAAKSESSIEAKRLHRLLRLFISSDIPDAEEVRAVPDGEGDASVNTLGTIEQASLSLNEVQDYLCSRLDPAIEVTDVVRLAGGFGKETILVRTQGPHGLGELVLRKVVPGRPSDILAPEFGMVEFASKHGLPVPKPLWIEMDPNRLGSPFFVTTRAGGLNAGDVYGPYPGVSPKVALHVARIMARLHSLDVAEVGPTPTVPMYTSAQVLDAIADQDKILSGVAQADELDGPLWRAVLAWLRSHIPAAAPEPVLVHSDVGFHNLLIANDRVEALLDWERSHLGTVAQDLAYIKPSIAALLPWNEFLGAYCDAGGTEPDEQSVRFYTVWQDTWRGIASLRLRKRFLAEDTPRLSDAIAGIMMSPRFLLTAVENAFGIDLPATRLV